MTQLRAGDLVFYDSRTVDERMNILSTREYAKIGCRVVAIDVSRGVATLQQNGGPQIFSDVPFAQIELQEAQ